jgi:hypothetical protein
MVLLSWYQPAELGHTAPTVLGIRTHISRAGANARRRWLALDYLVGECNPDLQLLLPMAVWTSRAQRRGTEWKAAGKSWAESPQNGGLSARLLSVQIVLPNLVEELPTADAQQSGRAGAVPLRLFQGVPDHPPLCLGEDVLEAQ